MPLEAPCHQQRGSCFSKILSIFVIGIFTLPRKLGFESREFSGVDWVDGVEISRIGESYQFEWLGSAAVTGFNGLPT